jgi:hypothetical protein
LAQENHTESWSQQIPSEEGYQRSAFVEYVDLNVNMCVPLWV